MHAFPDSVEFAYIIQYSGEFETKDKQEKNSLILHLTEFRVAPYRANIHKYLVSEEIFGRPTTEASKNIFSITWQIYVSRMRVVTAVYRLHHAREHDAGKDILT